MEKLFPRGSFIKKKKTCRAPPGTCCGLRAWGVSPIALFLERRRHSVQRWSVCTWMVVIYGCVLTSEIGPHKITNQPHNGRAQGKVPFREVRCSTIVFESSYAWFGWRWRFEMQISSRKTFKSENVLSGRSGRVLQDDF